MNERMWECHLNDALLIADQEQPGVSRPVQSGQWITDLCKRGGRLQIGPRSQC